MRGFICSLSLIPFAPSSQTQHEDSNLHARVRRPRNGHLSHPLAESSISWKRHAELDQESHARRISRMARCGRKRNLEVSNLILQKYMARHRYLLIFIMFRYIPRIKSHCAEERRLDLCVQKMRKKFLVESFVHQSSQNDNAVNLRNGTPSFFQAPSLVCMGGLGVIDPYETIESVGGVKGAHASSGFQISDHVDITSGWDGMGLRGNHSFTNLGHSTSNCSGIFIGEDSDNEQSDTDSNIVKTQNWSLKVAGISDSYIMTTHMANFYYRKSSTHGDLAAAGDENKKQDQTGRPRSVSMTNK